MEKERCFMIIKRGSFSSRLTVEFGPPPANAKEILARMERGRRNSQWLQTHWPDLLPQAIGKFVAVAGEEAFIANSAEEAWAWAARAHPEDDSATVRYVNPNRGPKIYENRG
jgi:hypothetical protein